MNQDKPKVSILVCVYNGAPFIDRCLKSLLKQTYKNIEIVIIDDGSTDQSPNILKKYANKYKNIKLINQKNGGLSKARNVSIQKASGEYITFVDIDDTIDSDFASQLVKQIHDKDVDVVVSGYKRVDDKAHILFQKLPNKNSMWAPYKFSIACAKMYRLSIIKKHQIFFPTKYRTLGEDIYFTILMLSKTKKITCIHYAGYNYFLNESSVTTQANENTQNRNKHMLNLLKDIEQKIKNSPNLNYKYLNFFFLKTIVFHLLTQRSILYGAEFMKEYQKYFNWLEKQYKKSKEKFTFYWQAGEDFKINLICNLFIIARKTHSERLLLYIINKAPLGKVH